MNETTLRDRLFAGHARSLLSHAWEALKARRAYLV